MRDIRKRRHSRRVIGFMSVLMLIAAGTVWWGQKSFPFPIWIAGGIPIFSGEWLAGILASVGMTGLLWAWLRYRPTPGPLSRPTAPVVRDVIRPSKEFSSSQPTATFADAAGVDETVDELRDIVDYLRDPGKYRRMGAEMPKGVILYGPPGTGKTLLARAVAGEAGVEFVACSGSQFVEQYVGLGAKKIRDLFDQVRRIGRPAIIFFDELDALGRRRGETGSSQEWDQTLNELLVQLDGFHGRQDIIVMGATNRLDILDPALLRPGRFDRHIRVDLPSIEGREKILRLHARNKPIHPAVDFRSLARRTPGFSGAMLKHLCNEAAIIAVKEEARQIEARHFSQAIDRVVAGNARRDLVLREKDRQITAYHEAGHALVGLIEGVERIQRISILPRGQALGFVLQESPEDRVLYTKRELLGKITMALGGRAAEELIFGDTSTGAEQDLEQATDLAWSVVARFGMSSLGLLSLRPHHCGGADLEAANQHARAVLGECYQNALDILARHRTVLDRVATRLLEKEVLEEEDFLQIVRVQSIVS
ncbi:ATP-dependent metalloprotease FtsH [Kyrpidia tusciae DSM 2912]|uniref:ATP-dependent zinc metalloprotease FtsH n=2 Tax=Kyrpidia TaxID=1129704 RepID=D5WPC8_KYRT2|nr:ATP-dependent metalloprotease FtsH [Kyrpidia tusciae DSM 2912]